MTLKIVKKCDEKKMGENDTRTLGHLCFTLEGAPSKSAIGIAENSNSRLKNKNKRKIEGGKRKEK